MGIAENGPTNEPQPISYVDAAHEYLDLIACSDKEDMLGGFIEASAEFDPILFPSEAYTKTRALINLQTDPPRTPEEAWFHQSSVELRTRETQLLAARTVLHRAVVKVHMVPVSKLADITEHVTDTVRTIQGTERVGWRQQAELWSLINGIDADSSVLRPRADVVRSHLPASGLRAINRRVRSLF